MNKKYMLLFIFLLVFFPLTSVLADDFIFQQSDTTAVDTRITSNAPTTNFGTNSVVAMGESNGGTGITNRSLFYFDLSSIPSNAVVTDVIFSLWIAGDSSSNSRTGYCSRLLNSFVESQATWNIRSTGNNWLDNAGSGDIDEVNTLLTYAFPASLSIDSEVQFTTPSISEWQKFIDGTYNNYGFACRMATELNDAYSFHSSSASNSAYYPKLLITYSLPNTPTATYTATITNTPTITVTPEFTFTPSSTLTNTPTYTITPEFTFTPSSTSEFTPTYTFTPNPTNTSAQIINDVSDLLDIQMNSGGTSFSTGGLILVLLLLYSASHVFRKLQE